MPYLEVQTKAGRKRFKLEDKAVTIGRQAGNTLVLSDDRSSRQHCVIEPFEAGYRVRDLGSRNGTRLNDQRIASELLNNGDVVKIGSTEIRYIDPEAASPTARLAAPRSISQRFTPHQSGLKSPVMAQKDTAISPAQNINVAATVANCARRSPNTAP